MVDPNPAMLFKEPCALVYTSQIHPRMLQRNAVHVEKGEEGFNEAQFFPHVHPEMLCGEGWVHGRSKSLPSCLTSVFLHTSSMPQNQSAGSFTIVYSKSVC